MVTQINLKLEFPDAGEICNVSAEFTDEELDQLKAYSRYCEELNATTLAKNGLPHLKSLRWEEKQRFAVETNTFEIERIHAFLHKARPLILKDEYASFERIKGLLGKKFQASEAIRKHLKVLGNLYQNGEYASYFQISAGGMDLFSDMVFRIWLNANEYHRDPEKREQIAKIEKTLSEGNAYKIFLAQLTQKARAIFQLSFLVNTMIKEANTIY